MTNSERFTTVQFGMDPEDLRVVERIAEERRVPRAVIFREAMDFWLSAKKKDLAVGSNASR